MSDLFRTIRSKFPVGWLTLLVGWRGLGNCPKLVDLHDVREFSLDSLARSEDVDTRVADLATISEMEWDRVDSVLASLAKGEASKYDNEVKKWIVVMLQQELSSLQNDPIEGLLQLTEFWSQFGFPDDSPHDVQSRGSMTPAEYYTRETYNRLLAQHKSWLEREMTRLSVCTYNGRTEKCQDQDEL